MDNLGLPSGEFARERTSAGLGLWGPAYMCGSQPAATSRRHISGGLDQQTF